MFEFINTMLLTLSNNWYSILSETMVYYFILNFVYYLANGILFLLDYYRMFTNKKINESVTTIKIINLYRKCVPTVLINTFVSSLLPMFMISWYQSAEIAPFLLSKCTIDIAISIVLLDVFLYAAHRIFHIPFLYQNFHKKHHEIQTPVGLSALYMSVSDFYFGNVLPIFLPMVILGAHPNTVKIWMVAAILNTTFLAHSGYVVANYHDKHHSLFNKNYGANIFMDRLLGTYGE